METSIRERDVMMRSSALFQCERHQEPSVRPGVCEEAEGGRLHVLQRLNPSGLAVTRQRCGGGATDPSHHRVNDPTELKSETLDASFVFLTYGLFRFYVRDI